MQTLISTPVQIPLSKTRLAATNPRKIKNPTTIPLLAASMKVSGLENPIKVRKLTSEERQTADEMEFELVGGERRFLAAQSLGWETIPATVLELTAPEALLTARLDNEQENMHWFDNILDTEAQWKTGAYPNQQALAEALGVSQ